MRSFRLILTLLLTLALSPWGAYAAIIGADNSDPANSAPVSHIVALPVSGEITTSVQGPSLCHGSALVGSACSPLSALLPERAELPIHLRANLRGETDTFWPEGPPHQPMLTPPRFS